MRIKLPSGKWIEANEQQIEALILMKGWLDGSAQPTNLQGNKNLFCLQGFAGTGKTTMVKELVDWFNNGIGRWQKEITVTAPTHTAKKEISNATGLKGRTIQGLCGLAPDIDVTDFDINNPAFALKNKPTAHLCSVIILDEASMLNTDLFDLLLQQTVGVKVLFMCDSAQLPPVNEEISPVIISEEIGFRYSLTKVERQAGDNPIMPTYDSIRNDIGSSTDQFEHKTSLLRVPNVEGGEDEVGIEFIKELNTFGNRVVRAFASKEFEQDPRYCKLFCWTNKQVEFWNNEIRKVLILKRRKEVAAIDPEDVESTLHDSTAMPNELLVGYKNYTDGLVNSAQYRIIQIAYDTESMDYGDFVNNSPLEGRKFMVDIAVYRVILEEITEKTQIACCIIENNPENYAQFLLAHNYYHSLGVEKRWWTKYYSWKEQYMLLTDIRSKANKVIVKKDLDYGYAMTVHKAQGSTYHSVFVDEDNIDRLEDRPFMQYFYKEDMAKARKEKTLVEFMKKHPTFDTYFKKKQVEKNKLKYVALSRPRMKATVLSAKTVEP